MPSPIHIAAALGLLALAALLWLAYRTWRKTNAARWTEPSDTPATAFWWEGRVYSLEEILEANAHDEDFCAWARTAKVGDTYVNAWFGSHVAVIGAQK